MTPVNDNWARIYAVVSYANMTTNYFARHIGLASGENLYRIKRGINGISRDLAERIVSFFPEISKAWLMTGAGCMFSGEEGEAMQIPFFQGDNLHILNGYHNMQPAYYLFVPPADMCDLAIEMEIARKSGKTSEKNIYLLKKIEEKTLKAGCEYISVKENCITLHKLPKRPKTTGMKVDDFDLVYVVKGKLTVF